MKLVTVEQMRCIEARAAEAGFLSHILMENAGRASAQEIAKCIDRIEGYPILILTGPGNNGGDGLVTARYLHDWGADIKLYLCTERPVNDPNYILTQNKKVLTIKTTEDKEFIQLEYLLHSNNFIIDAILGIGKSRLISGVLKEITTRVNKARLKYSHLTIFSLDIPSGLDSDTGHMDAAGIKADITITLGYPKVGLFSFPGASNTRRIITADIGIPSETAQDVNVEITTTDFIKSILPERPSNANKGTFGKVLVIGGSSNYIGAPCLACSGAMHIGTGLVTLATATSLQPISATKLTEVTYLPLPEQITGIIGLKAIEIIKEHLQQYDVLLIGCGLGQNPDTIKFVRSLLISTTTDIPSRLVVDADALNIIAQSPEWWQKIPDDVILTPHPGEMSRLTGRGISDIQAQRIDIAREAALLWHKTVVLKGAYTVIAAPDGRVRVNPNANPGLSSAGTGDVLSGVIAGLAAQGMSSFNAASCGVFLHSTAGEIIKEKIGDTGILASDLLSALPLAIKQIKNAP